MHGFSRMDAWVDKVHEWIENVGLVDNVDGYELLMDGFMDR